MSSHDRCFVCEWTGHFGYHCIDAHCYGCDEFGHFFQDCPNKIPPSGTPCHQDRSHIRHQYTTNWRDRSHSYYGQRHRRHFSRSQSCHCLHCNRRSSFRRYTSCSSSSHCSSLHHPLADGCPITTHAMTPAVIVAPHPTVTTSPTEVTHATPQTRASLAPATPTTQHRNLSPEKPNNGQDPQP